MYALIGDLVADIYIYYNKKSPPPVSISPGKLFGIFSVLIRYRDLHSISYKEHEDLLSEHGWTEEEFEAGFQKSVPPRDGSKDFLKYEALVRRELANGEVRWASQRCSR